MARVPHASADELSERDRKLLGSYDELGEEYTPHLTDPPEWIREGSRDRDSPPPLYGAMAHNPPILEGFRRMASTLRAACGLSERRRELVILAAAREAGVEYEWHQHVRIGRAAGVSVAEIRAIADGEAGPFDDPEAALVEYVRRLVSGTVSDDAHAALSAHFDDCRIVGIGMVAQFYLGLGRFIEAVDLGIGEPFVGWGLENLEAD